jgi:hypothetical protein
LDDEDHFSDVDTSLIDTETGGELDQQLMVSTAGIGCIIPSKRNMDNPVALVDLYHNEKCKAEQPAAVLIYPEDGQEVQCEEACERAGWGEQDSGSLGHEHGGSLEAAGQHCNGIV